MASTRHHTDERQTSDEAPEAVLARDAERSTRAHPLLWGLLLGVAAVVAVVLVVVQNTGAVRFEWLVLDVDAPLWLLMVASAAAGAAVLALAAVVARTARRRATRRRAAVDQVRGRSRARGGRRVTA